jgi:methyltransferase
MRFFALYLLTAAERLVELVVSKRNLAWSRARGGVEYGQSHYPWMVVLHTTFLVAAPIEVVALDRAFAPWLGVPMLTIAVGAQFLRWWCIRTLGERWNTRVVIVPSLPRIAGGPYRWFNHPNYLAVVTEGVALPLVHSAWLTAVGFTVLNALLLRERLRVEDAALSQLPGGDLESAR